MSSSSSFVEYFKAIGKPIQNGESVPFQSYDKNIVKCDENEYIDIHPDARITG
ncbi:hypothetical protein OAV88_03405 [bacterium]|nr:hypothetical protein [bacterium]